MLAALDCSANSVRKKAMKPVNKALIFLNISITNR
jgi:hypothetical protein